MISNPSRYPGSPANTKSPSSWSDPWFYSLLACFLLAVLLGARLLCDSDLGFHLRGGQWILQNHAFPSNDTFTYTVTSHDYLDIHWLYQVLLFSFYRLGGYILISLLNVGLVGILFFLTYRRLQLAQAPAWLSVLLLSAVLFTTENRFRARPETLSWVLLSLTLWVLELRALRKRDLLFLLPLLHLFWANMEGLFPLGWLLMGLYWFSGFVHDRKSDKILLGYSLLSVAVCLLNPYFFRGWCFPFTLWKTVGTSNVFKQNIDEFQPTWAYLSNPTHMMITFFYELFFILLLILILATFKRRKIHEYLLTAIFLAISLAAFRNIGLFMIACVPLVASCWKDLSWNWLSCFQRAFLTKPLFAWGFTLVLLGLGLRVATGAYYIQNRRPEHFGLGLDEEAQPVQACRFLVQNKLEGRVLNSLSLGGWLDWQGLSGKTFIDGRLETMGSDVFSEYVASWGPGKLRPLLEKYQAQILLMKPQSPFQWILELRQMADWRPVYLDGVAAVFLRKGCGDGVPTLDYNRLMAENGIAQDLVSGASALIQSPPLSAWKSFWEDFARPVPYPFGLYNMGFFFTAYTGHPETAEPLFLEAIRRTSGKYPEFYYYLAGIFYSSNRFNEATLCMKRIAGANPRQWQMGPGQ